MSVQTRPVQVQPNPHVDVKPPPLPHLASPEEELQVVHLTTRDLVKIGPRALQNTIRCKEDKVRFQFDDDKSRVWLFLETKPGEEIVAWIPYTNIANVYFGLRSTLPAKVVA